MLGLLKFVSLFPSGILEFSDSSTFNQLFGDLVRTLLELIESSETTATVSTIWNKTFDKDFALLPAELVQ